MKRRFAAALLLAACGGGAPGNEAVAPPAKVPLPGPVTAVHLGPAVGAILVTWDEPQGAAPTGYLAQEIGGGSQRTTAERRTAYFAGLSAGPHCFQVYALAGAGTGPGAPQPACARAYAPTISPAGNVRALAIPRGLHVTWDPPAANDGPPIESWIVAVRPPSASAKVTVSGTGADIVGLEENATYVARVRASGAGAVSDFAESYPVTVATIWPTTGAWRQAASLPEGQLQATFVARGRLYAVGMENIYSAPLDSEGRPTAWTVAGSSKGVGFGSTSAFTSAGDFLYVTGGGETMAGNYGLVFVARIAPDGSVGPFSQTAAIAPGPKFHAAVADQGHLYVVGGFWWSGGSYTGIGTVLPFIQVADIGGDGRLGAWRRTAFLPRPGRFSAAVWNHRLYVLSGNGPGIDVFFASLGADGSVGAFRRASAQPSHPIRTFTLGVAAGRLYLFGNNRPSSAVTVGQIGDDGDLTAWEESAADAFNGPRTSPLVALTDARAYLLGGSFTPFFDVQWAAIDPATGHFAPWDPQPSTVPDAPRQVSIAAGFTSLVVSWNPPAHDGGRPITGYSVTGFTGDAEVLHADVDAPATSLILTGLRPGVAYTLAVAARNSAGVGAGSGPSDEVVSRESPKWRPLQDAGLVASRSAGPILAGDVLAFFGDRRTAVPLDDRGVPWGQIGPGWASEGRFHDWATASRSIDATTTCGYRVGGAELSQTTGRVVVDCIRGDGFFGVGLAAPASAPALAPTRMFGAAVVAGSFLYVLGGTNQDVAGGPHTDLDDVSFAPIAADNSLGAWRHTTALPARVSMPAAVARGKSLYVLAGEALLRATPGADGGIAAWESAGTPAGLSGARLAVLGDILYAVTPGAVLRGHFAADGAIDSWDSDPQDAPRPLTVLGVVPGPAHLYLWADGGLFSVRIAPGGQLVAE